MCNDQDLELELSDYVTTEHAYLWSILSQPVNGDLEIIDNNIDLFGSAPGTYLLQFMVLDDLPPNCQLEWELELQIEESFQLLLPEQILVCDTVSDLYTNEIILNDLIVEESL